MLTYVSTEDDTFLTVSIVRRLSAAVLILFYKMLMSIPEPAYRPAAAV